MLRPFLYSFAYAFINREGIKHIILLLPQQPLIPLLSLAAWMNIGTAADSVVYSSTVLTLPFPPHPMAPEYVRLGCLCNQHHPTNPASLATGLNY